MPLLASSLLQNTKEDEEEKADVTLKGCKQFIKHVVLFKCAVLETKATTLLIILQQKEGNLSQRGTSWRNITLTHTLTHSHIHTLTHSHIYLQ